MSDRSAWPELYRAAIALPERCFDGYFAEGISDTLVRKMGQDWSGYMALLARHPDDEIFMSVVLRSINASVDLKDVQVVARRAASECPAKLTEQCAAISRRAAETLKE